MADNVRVDDEDDNIMHFEWTISRNVTSVSGFVTFLVCIKSVDESGDEQEHWNSERCSDISVAPGLETGEPIEEKYPDVLTQLSDKYDTLNKAAARINDATIGTDSTYSSKKIENLVDTVLPSGGEDGNVLMKKSQGEIWGKVIDDTQPSSTTTTLSASGITQALDTLEETIEAKAGINDSQTTTTNTWSAQKIQSQINLGDYNVYYFYTEDVKTVNGLDFTIEIDSSSITFKDGDIVIALPQYINEVGKNALLNTGGWFFKSAEIGTKTVTLTACKKAPLVGNWLGTIILLIRSKGG